MAAESNRRYQDLHAAARNAIHVLSPPAPVGMTLVDYLRTMPPRIMEVATNCIHLGAASTMVAPSFGWVRT